MSSLDPLIDVIARAKATELHLVPGERTFVIRKGKRLDVGRDVVQQGNVSLLAAEVMGPARVLAAHDAPQTARVARLGYTVDVVTSVGAAGLEVALHVVDRPEIDDGPSSAGSIPAASLSSPPRRTSRVLELEAPPIETAAPPGPSTTDTDVTLPPMERTVAPPIELTVARTATRATDLNSVDALLRDMVAHHASDLHLAAGYSPVMRIQGELHFLTDLSELGPDQVSAYLDPILSERARRDLADHKDATFIYEVKDLGRFRINVGVDARGLALTFRHVQSELPAFERYGLSPGVVEALSAKGGLVLVASAPGHGRSTTLASMVDYLNWTRSDHVVTIERPIEHVHPIARCLLSQREVGEHTESFATAMESALRERPDVLVLGELPDAAVTRTALDCAGSGTLVIASLRASSVVGALERVVDTFGTEHQPKIRQMLADSTRAVVAQVLCWKTGGGRVPAIETLLTSSLVATLVREGKWSQLQPVVQGARHMGMVSMGDALAELVSAEQISAAEAWARAPDRTALAASFKAHGIALPA